MKICTRILVYVSLGLGAFIFLALIVISFLYGVWILGLILIILLAIIVLLIFFSREELQEGIDLIDITN